MFDYDRHPLSNRASYGSNHPNLPEKANLSMEIRDTISLNEASREQSSHEEYTKRASVRLIRNFLNQFFVYNRHEARVTF